MGEEGEKQREKREREKTAVSGAIRHIENIL